MDGSVQNNSRTGADEFFRWLCFLLFSTVGMGAIGLSLLAGPWSQHYADKALVDAQQRHLARLHQLRQQQEELLANSANPSVIERAAIGNLNYVPAGIVSDSTGELPATWPNLKSALDHIDRQSLPPVPDRRQSLPANLADSPRQQMLLMILGSLLVLLSLSCFYRQR